MSMWKQPVKTNWLLWFASSAAIFVSAWFIPTGTHKSPYIGSEWLALFRGEWLDPWPRAIWFLGLQTVFVSVCAAILGWMSQAVVVALVAIVRPARSNRV